MKLFLTRIISAICLYLCLTISNKQSIEANLILVSGYRFFLIFTPMLERLFHKYSLKVTLGFIPIGLTLNFIGYDLLGSLLISIGLSISGFLIKKLAAETPRLAGINKVALSAGNIIAGALLYFTHNTVYFAWGIALCLMVIAIAIAPQGTTYIRQKTFLWSHIKLKKDLAFYAAWFCIGIVIGIRIFGLYTVLPTYLLEELGTLPDWYGTMLTLYGVLTIGMQWPAISKKFHPTLGISLIVLGASCVIIGIPNLLNAKCLIGCAFWVFLLAIEEMFAPYIDFYSAKEGKLFVKEISISIGAGLCVWLMRTTEMPLVIAVVACILLFIGHLCLIKTNSYRKD